MQHYMNLHNDPFEKIKNGTKTVEMRLFDDKRRAISVGDVITFTNVLTSEQLSAQVTDIKTFATFNQLYGQFDKVSIGYNLHDVANPNDMLAYYTAEQIAKFGVVAICIKLC